MCAEGFSCKLTKLKWKNNFLQDKNGLQTTVGVGSRFGSVILKILGAGAYPKRPSSAIMMMKS